MVQLWECKPTDTDQWPGGSLPLAVVCTARMGRVPFWPISVPQRVGFSCNVPLSIGFWTPIVCQRGSAFSSGCARENAEYKRIALNWPNFRHYTPTIAHVWCTNKPLMNNNCATDGTLFSGFVTQRVWIWAQSLPLRLGVLRYCPSRGIHFPGEHTLLGPMDRQATKLVISLLC